MVKAKYKNVHILFDENLTTEFCTDDNTEQFKLHFTEIHKQVNSLENHQGALCTSMTRRVIPVGLRFWQGHPCWTGQRVKVRRKVIHRLPRLGVGHWTEKVFRYGNSNGRYQNNWINWLPELLEDTEVKAGR